MQVKLITYEHAANGVSLFVVPETDAERELLRGIWKHGQLSTCNGVADDSSQGFKIGWKMADETAKNVEKSSLI